MRVISADLIIPFEKLIKRANRRAPTKKLPRRKNLRGNSVKLPRRILVLFH